jgi:hypothetical protein
VSNFNFNTSVNNAEQAGPYRFGESQANLCEDAQFSGKNTTPALMLGQPGNCTLADSHQQFIFNPIY